MKMYKAQPLDLMQFINTKYHEPFIHARIEWDDRPDLPRFIAALDTLLSVFPILKCRYNEADNTFVENGLTGKDLLIVADTGDRNGLLTESLDMCRQLIRFTATENTLYITVSHLVCDGSGFKQLVYLLCDIYNGVFDGDGGCLMKRELSLLTRELSGKGFITVKMLLSMMKKYDNKPIYEKTPVEAPHAVERLLSREDMQSVHARAKAQGATLNDVFLTAYARALGKRQGLDRVNIPCTVDLRKYAKEPMGIANLTGSYSLNITAGNKPFAQALSAVSSQMRKQKSTKNDIAGPMLLVSKYEKSSLDDFLRLYGGMETGAFSDYTNLGIWDDKRLAFDGAGVKSAVGYSGMSKAPFFQLALSSFRGETTVSALFQCAESERGKAEQIIDAFVFEIQAFANG